MNRFRFASLVGVPVAALTLTGIGVWARHGAAQYSYYRDVAPIMSRRCSYCHSGEGLAARPRLDTYEEVSNVGPKIKYMVQSRMMPPWIADNSGICGKWNDASWLTNDELATLVHWEEQGMPAGEPSERPPPKRADLPDLGRTDATLDTGADYKPGLGPSAYRCFVVDPELERDRLLTGIRVVSTDPRMVAQVTMFSLESEDAEAAASKLDGDDPGPGYSCYGSPRVDPARLITSWTWGAPSQPFPKGTGLRLDARRKMVIQVHYNVITSGLNATTRTRIELRFDDGARPASFLALAPGDLTLAPGKTYVEAAGELTVDRPTTVLAVAPRMHSLARTMQIDLVHAGARSCAANFDHWNFYSQRLFTYEKPLHLEPGDRLRVNCIYNTESVAQPVRRGESIRDEECTANLYIVP